MLFFPLNFPYRLHIYSWSFKGYLDKTENGNDLEVSLGKLLAMHGRTMFYTGELMFY